MRAFPAIPLRHRYRPGRKRGDHETVGYRCRRTAWSWLTVVLVGLMLTVWIAVEVLIIGYQPSPPLQLIYGLLGFLILALGLAPGLKPYLAEPGNPPVEPNDTR